MDLVGKCWSKCLDLDGPHKKRSVKPKCCCKVPSLHKNDEEEIMIFHVAWWKRPLWEHFKTLSLFRSLFLSRSMFAYEKGSRLLVVVVELIVPRPYGTTRAVDNVKDASSKATLPHHLARSLAQSLCVWMLLDQNNPSNLIDRFYVGLRGWC